MFGSIKDYLVKNLLIGFIKRRLFSLVEDLPDIEQEIVTAVLINLFDHIVTKLPSTEEYLDPIIDGLKDMPVGQIATGGVVDKTVGEFKNAFDWVVNLTRGKTSTQVAALNQEALSNIG